MFVRLISYLNSKDNLKLNLFLFKDINILNQNAIDQINFNLLNYRLMNFD